MTKKNVDGTEVQGVQNVEIGLRMAYTIAAADASLSLGELADAVGIYPSKVHRYLVSLCRSGLLEQDYRSGRYDLGPKALMLGLAAQSRLDKFRMAEEAIDQLQAETSMTVSATVWSEHGPIIFARREPLHPVTINTRVGSVLQITTSAAGRLYAAYLPDQIVRPFIERENQAAPPLKFMGKEVARVDFYPVVVETIRHMGISPVSGDYMSGIDAVAVPVFDQSDQLVMTLTVLATQGSLDFEPDARISTVIRNIGNQLSKRLGCNIDHIAGLSARRHKSR
jgi:DNA-binding IclR family transcriptional regulator